RLQKRSAQMPEVLKKRADLITSQESKSIKDPGPPFFPRQRLRKEHPRDNRAKCEDAEDSNGRAAQNVGGPMVAQVDSQNAEQDGPDPGRGSQPAGVQPNDGGETEING